MIQKSERLKVVKFVLGASILVFSGYRFFNITNPSPFFVMYPGLAVLAIGIITILKGFLNKEESKTTKSIEISIGVIGIAVGLYVKFFTDAMTSSISLVMLFLIINGTGFLVTGITQRDKTKAIRIPKIIIGVSVVPTIGLLFTYPDWSLILISGLLSVKMLLIGIEIITGAIGDKAVKRSHL